jgi:transposase InsO family protein
VPWKVSHHMDERTSFVARLRAGERMTDLCREFGISRKAGYKFWSRYKARGPGALEDESRAPHRRPRKTAPELEQLVVDLRRAHPNWGGRMIRGVLLREHPELLVPAEWTCSEILKRNGLIKPRKRRRYPRAYAGALTNPEAPNKVWGIDYKGQFRLGSGSYCYPLTISDLHSRFLLATESLAGTDAEAARHSCEEVFAQYGLPEVIRSDNGVPFASRGVGGLTTLSAWWMRLGIKHERIEKGHPEQNGVHERMHRTLKAETTRPAGANSLIQQERFDRFRAEFNERRPHQALGMKLPADVYTTSERKLPKRLPEPEYPLHDDVVIVGRSGHVRMASRRHVFLSEALVGQAVGLRERDDGKWLVTFVSLNLGCYDPRSGEFEPYVPLPPGDGA